MGKLFHDEDPFHIETSPLFCSEKQWTGFYMIGTSAMKEESYQRTNCQELMLSSSSLQRMFFAIKELIPSKSADRNQK